MVRAVGDDLVVDPERRCGVSTSGAPRTHAVPSRVTCADQRSEEVNMISSRIYHASPGSAAASAVQVRFGWVTEAAYRASASRTSSELALPSGRISGTVSRPVVRVPV
jgi:hypothetical protein